MTKSIFKQTHLYTVLTQWIHTIFIEQKPKLHVPEKYNLCWLQNFQQLNVQSQITYMHKLWILVHAQAKNQPTVKGVALYSRKDKQQCPIYSNPITALVRPWVFQEDEKIGTWRWLGCQPYAPAAFTPRKYSWYSFLLKAESTTGP
jgi:hypothetical protein